jgi:protein ImuB
LRAAGIRTGGHATGIRGLGGARLMYAALYIPDFPLQAILRLQEEWRGKSFAVLDAENRVAHMTAAARGDAVELGMTPTQAMARSPGIILRARSAMQEEAAQAALLQCAAGFSPFIEATGQGVATINLRGLAKFDEADANRLLERVGALQLRGKVGIASDPDVAWLAARTTERLKVIEDVDLFLRGVGIEEAAMPAGILEVVRKWGLRSVGELRALGTDELASRFGSEMVAFLERVAPRRPRPLTWVTPPAEFAEGLELENEIESLEPLLFLLRRFLDQLAQRLEAVYLVARELRLTLKLAAGDPHERVLSVPAPTRDVNTLFRMLHTHLEGLRTEAPIVAVELRAEPARAQQHQFGLFEASLRDPNQFFETIARLEALLGPGRCGTPVNEASYKPDVFKMEAPRFHDGAELAEFSNADRVATIGLSLRRFRPPVPARVTIAEEQPVQLQSARAKGKIAVASGPWRSSGNWWEDGANWGRDEWDIRLANGRMLRMFKHQDEWFVEGEFD